MSNKKILIVEDEKMISELIHDTLKNLGYTVTDIVNTGEKAMKAVEGNPPDLILMDIILDGEMDGIETAARILSTHDIPVIYLTGQATDELLHKAKITEPYGYLVKPIKERELHATIEMGVYRHYLEEKLKERERWLQTILKSIGSAVIVFDEKLKVSLMNPAAELLTGWPKNKAKGRSYTSIFQIIGEETHILSDDPVLKSVYAKEIIGLKGQTILVNRRNEQIPIDGSAAPIVDEKGAVIGVVLAFRDIGEIKKAMEAVHISEQKYRYLFEAESDAIVIFDAASHQFIDINPAGLELYKYSKQEILDLSFEDLFVETGEKKYPDISKIDYISTIPFCWHKNRNGETFPVEMSLGGYSFHNRLVGFAIIRDISLRFEAEEQLWTAKEAKEEASRAKDIFLSGLSTEILEPITDIIREAEEGKKIQRHDQMQSAFGNIKTSAENLQNMIHDIIDYSRIESKELNLSPNNFRLPEQIVHISEYANQLCRHKDLKFSIFIDDDVPEIIHGDAARIEQVLKNLVHNAIKFTTNGEVRLNIRIKNQTDSSIELVFAVQDTGVGIPETQVPKLFWIFSKLEGGNTTKSKGAGFGLAISKKIAEMMGGTIWVESREGKGSTFFFSACFPKK